MPASKLRHKRGDTLVLDCRLVDDAGNPMDITGWTIVSKIKTSRYAAIATLDTEMTDAEIGSFRITGTETGTWPVGSALMDVRYTDGSGRVMSTETVPVEILREVSGS